MRLGLTGFQGLMGFPSKVGVETDQDNFTVIPAGRQQGFCSACRVWTKLGVWAHLDRPGTHVCYRQVWTWWWHAGMRWGLLRTVSRPHLHCRTLTHCSWHFTPQSRGFKI